MVQHVQLSAEGGLHVEVDPLGGVASAVELDDEWGGHGCEDVLLVDHVVLHLHPRDVALAHHLDGVGLLRPLVLSELHLAECAHTQCADQFEVLEQHRLREVGPQGRLDLRRHGLVHAHLSHPLRARGYAPVGRCGLLHDLPDGAQEHVEAPLVKHERLRHRRDHLDGRRARLVVDQGALPEVVRHLFLLRRLVGVHPLAVFEDRDLTVIQDVEGVAFRALLEHYVVLLEAHLCEGLRYRPLLLVQERAEHLHTLQ
mmetsp:Transcript_56420/g.167957  ORF Transcript_56420/g.167957 Transcript_56420/m.167957 type:complete len:256 (+) Transcript_56420:710-1477(+)